MPATVTQGGAQCKRSNERLSITIFQYYGIIDARKKDLFSNFRGVLRGSIESVVEQLAGNLNSPGLESFTLNPTGDVAPDQEPMNYAETYRIWCDSLSLQLLRGNIITENNKIIVRSRVFIGDLGKNINKSSIALDLPFNLDGYEVLSDTHQFLILYSLAMDYASRNQNKGTIISLLVSAHDKYTDIKLKSPVYLDLELLIRSIEAELQKYKSFGR